MINTKFQFLNFIRSNDFWPPVYFFSFFFKELVSIKHNLTAKITHDVFANPKKKNIPVLKTILLRIFVFKGHFKIDISSFMFETTMTK